ncbi:unnamed protein product, partial [Ixodes persulcatus]
TCFIFLWFRKFTTFTVRRFIICHVLYCRSTLVPSMFPVSQSLMWRLAFATKPETAAIERREMRCQGVQFQGFSACDIRVHARSTQPEVTKVIKK